MSASPKLSVLAVIALGLFGCVEIGSKVKSIAPETPLVVAENTHAITYGEVISGNIKLAPKIAPAPLEKLKASSACRTPKARVGAKAAYVYTYGGGDHVPLQHVNFIDTPDAAAKRRENIQAAKKSKAVKKAGWQARAIGREAASFKAGNMVEWSSRVDVLVTETDAPVFLYLTSYNSVMWNIQRAPGVKIDGIVVNSYDAGAIANGVEPSRTAIISFANSPHNKCHVNARGRLATVEERVARAKKLNPDIDLSNYKLRWQKEYREGQKFFRSELPRLIGKRPDWLINDARSGSFKAVLVGSGEAKITAEPITRIQIPAHITSFWGSRDAAFVYFGLDDLI